MEPSSGLMQPILLHHGGEALLHQRLVQPMLLHQRRRGLLRLPTAWFQLALCALSLVAALAMLLRAVTAALGPHSAAPIDQDPS